MNTSFDEIVGFIVNKKTIYYGPQALIVIKALGDYGEPIYRCVADFMAVCDLGENWKKLCLSDTLIFMKDKNTIDQEKTWEQWKKFGFKRKGGECES